MNFNIDESKHIRQDDFQLKRNLKTNYWSIKFNTSIFVMYDVDTYYLGKACEHWYGRKPEELYYNLA